MLGTVAWHLTQDVTLTSKSGVCPKFFHFKKAKKDGKSEKLINPDCG